LEIDQNPDAEREAIKKSLISKILLLELKEVLTLPGYIILLLLVFFGLCVAWIHIFDFLPHPHHYDDLVEVYFDCPGAFKVIFFAMTIICDILKFSIMGASQLRKIENYAYTVSSTLIFLCVVYTILIIIGDSVLILHMENEQCNAYEKDLSRTMEGRNVFMFYYNASLLHNFLILYVQITRYR